MSKLIPFPRSKLRQQIERVELRKMSLSLSLFGFLFIVSFIFSIQQNQTFLMDQAAVQTGGASRSLASVQNGQVESWQADHRILEDLNHLSRRNPASPSSHLTAWDRLQFEYLKGNYNIFWNVESANLKTKEINSLQLNENPGQALMSYQDFQNLVNRYPSFFDSRGSDDTQIRWLDSQKAELSMLKSGQKLKTYELELNDQLEILSLKLVKGR